jgi:hypothetical protein
MAASTAMRSRMNGATVVLLNSLPRAVPDDSRDSEWLFSEEGSTTPIANL